MTLTLREVHLVQTPRELALLDLLREVGVPKSLGELDAAIVTARLCRPQQRRRGGFRSLGEGVRDRIGLRHVKVDRPIILVRLRMLHVKAATVDVRATTGAGVDARCPVAARVRVRVMHPVVVRRFS